MNTSPSAPPASPGLLAIPQSAIAFVPDLDDAQRLAYELDPSATLTELEQRAHDILAGRLLVIRHDAPLTFDAAAPEQAPWLCALMGGR